MADIDRCMRLVDGPKPSAPSSDWPRIDRPRRWWLLKLDRPTRLQSRQAAISPTMRSLVRMFLAETILGRSAETLTGVLSQSEAMA